MKYRFNYFNFNYIETESINNLIISFALNYSYLYMKYFIKSLKRTKYKGNIIFFTFAISEKLQKLLKNNTIEWIALEKEYPFYPFIHKHYPIERKNVIKYLYNFKGKSFVTYRYFIIKLFLTYHGKNFNHVLLSDIRDVIFQANPFNWNINNGVYLVEEHPHRRIGDDKSNKMYVKYYKPDSQLYRKTIINGGIIYGSYPAILFFLVEFLDFICSFHCNANDQGGLNAFVRKKKIFPYPIFLLNSSHTPVRTLALWLFDSSKCCLPINYVILNKDNSLPLIIHQYDRAIKANYRNENLSKQYIKYILYQCNFK